MSAAGPPNDDRSTGRLRAAERRPVGARPPQGGGGAKRRYGGRHAGDDARLPVTPAVRVLRAHDVPFTNHPYRYEERGGTAVSARELRVDEHAVIKTLIMEDDAERPLIVLMHGDRDVSTKALARILGVKSVEPCTPANADRHSGYQVGGTSPFGTRKPMPVYAERSITELPYLYVNGGRRGYLVGMTPADLVRVLNPALVDAATAELG